MVVVSIFWFHPLVWWLGARLLEERERACDEEVLQLGNAPLVYAESILKTCEFCVGSPLACISGVTGADLKSRITRIMSEPIALKLGISKKLLLAAAGTVAAVGPLVFGLMREPQTIAVLQVTTAAAKLPAYEVASVKPDKSGTDMMMIRTTAVGFSAKNVLLKELIRNAYGIEENQIQGAPGWLGSARYDIEAKVSSSDTDALHDVSPEQRGLMLQPLLAERFQLKVHSEVRDLPVLALVVAKDGPKLHEARPGDTYPNGIKGFDGEGGAGLMHMGPGQLTVQGLTMSSVARLLSEQLGLMVQNATGLTGNYDFTLQWSPDRGTTDAGQPGPDNAASKESAGPSVFTAVQEQLGLKLESRKSPVEVLVIDHVEKPSEN
jgi:bla regulator protein BlaR1